MARNTPIKVQEGDAEPDRGEEKAGEVPEPASDSIRVGSRENQSDTV